MREKAAARSAGGIPADHILVVFELAQVTAQEGRGDLAPGCRAATWSIVRSITG